MQTKNEFRKIPSVVITDVTDFHNRIVNV